VLDQILHKQIQLETSTRVATMILNTHSQH